MSAGIPSFDIDASPPGLGVIALGSWTVGLATVTMAACLCLLGRGGTMDADKSGLAREPQMMT